jgi:hypothetical protein
MNNRQNTRVDADAAAWIAGLTTRGEVASTCHTSLESTFFGKPEIATDTLKSK